MQSTNKDEFFPGGVPQPKLVRPRHIGRLIFILSILCLTTFYCGYCLAYITALGTTNIAIVYGPTSSIPVVKAFLISSLPFGVCIGTFFSIWILPLASRRNLTLILCIVAQVLQGFIHLPYLPAFFIIRICQGIVTGFFLAVVPIYIRQISPKQVNKKGIYGIFGPLFVILGFMASFGFNTIMLKTGVDQVVRWRVVISINFFAILAILIFILLNIIPQSPNSLIAKGQQQKAKQVIGLFHAQKFIDELYQQKIKQIEDAKKPPAPTPKDRPLFKTILAIQLPVMHQLTGVNAYISQMGFVTQAFDNGFGQYVPFLMGGVQVITALYSITYLYRINRRRMVLTGNLAMSLCCFGIGISFLFINQSQSIFWIVVGFIVIFMGFNGATLVPGVMTVVTEIGTKDEIRWANVTNWFATGTSVAVFILIGNYFNYQAIFLTFGVCTLILFIFNFIYLIDTKPNLKAQVNIQLSKLDFSKIQTISTDRQQAQNLQTK